MKSNMIPNNSGSEGMLSAGPVDLSLRMIARGVQNAIIYRRISIRKIDRYITPTAKGAAATQYISLVRKYMLNPTKDKVMA